ncbi:glycerate kinase [Herbiconiux ginsengi]
MNVVFAPDSFKGTMGAANVAAALAEGWLWERPEDKAVLLPMADGGEGTMAAFAAAVPGAERVAVRVTGPDGSPVDSAWLRLPPTPDLPSGTAIIELGATSGIELLERLRPLEAHTVGLGQAIAAALTAGVSRIVVGLGSSASTDGGAGLLQALGARFLNAGGADVPPGGAGLSAIATVDLTGLVSLPPGGVVALTDVTNPLLGAAGSAAVFGPQKGADPGQVAQLDTGLAHFADLVDADPSTPGAGAAGGAGFGLLAWGATLQPGSSTVGELIGLPNAGAQADIIVTGEGSYDGQSAAGKVPAYVASLAGAGTSVLLVAGRIAPDAELSAFASFMSLTDLAGSAEHAMADTGRWLRAAGAQLARGVV